MLVYKSYLRTLKNRAMDGKIVVAIFDGKNAQRRRNLKAEARAAKKSPFLGVRRADQQYGVALRKIARAVGDIVTGHAPNGIVTDPSVISGALDQYAELLRPWAKAVSWRMLTDVAKRDEHAWKEHGLEMGRALHKEIQGAEIGDTMRKLLDEQVDLITSIPRDAGKRVHKIATEARVNSSRADELAKEIMRTSEVTASRATLIARTETARVSATLNRARAESVGATHYVWMTANDASVRHDHRVLAGKVFRYDDPPISDQAQGIRAGPGEIFNCRCYGVAVI